MSRLKQTLYMCTEHANETLGMVCDTIITTQNNYIQHNQLATTTQTKKLTSYKVQKGRV